MLSSWSSCCSGFSQRWVFAIMSFLGLWLGNALRVVLSITITEMTLPITEITNQLDDICSEIAKPIPKNVTISNGNLYDWDEYTQGIILSSYFWGYAVTQFPAGFLSERYGGKHFLGIGVFVPAILTFLTPASIAYGEATALIVLRVAMGLVSGALYPAASAMLPRWTAPSERTKFGSIVYAGGMLGTVCGTTLAALIIRYSGLGWPAVFHFFGSLGMVWFPVWLLLCYNCPSKHPFISESELKYLEETSERKEKPPSAPWGHILTSKPNWAFIVAMFGLDWAYFTLASDLPKYMSSVIRFSIEDNGYLSAVPYLCAWFFSMLCFWIIDRVVENKWLSLASTRKSMATVAIMGPAIFILGASYAGCDQSLVVAMFICGVTLMGATYASVVVNPMDLSPNYSGTLMALGNGIAAVGGIFSPYVVGVLTPNQTLGEWRVVFWIVFAMATIATTFFLVYGSTEVQPWNDPSFLRNEKKQKKMESEKQKRPDAESARL